MVQKMIAFVFILAAALAGIGLLGAVFWPWDSYPTFPVGSGNRVEENVYTRYGCMRESRQPETSVTRICGERIRDMFPPLPAPRRRFGANRAIDIINGSLTAVHKQTAWRTVLLY